MLKRIAAGPAALALLMALTGCSIVFEGGSGPSATVTVTATGEASESPSPSVSVSPRNPGEVDPQYFALDGGGYGFSSPSGNLHCSIKPPNETTVLVGCMSDSPVANLAECEIPNTDGGPLITLVAGRGAEPGCGSEGFAGGRVLEYGEKLRVEGATCASENTGITCVEDATGLGFKAARAGFQPVS